MSNMVDERATLSFGPTIERGADAFALVGVEYTQIPTSVVLGALLTQVDHYASEEVDTLAELAGVEFCSGYAMLFEGDLSTESLPPGFTTRRIGATAAIFYPYRCEKIRERFVAEGRDARQLPEVRESLARALDRYAVPGEWHPNVRLLPWEQSYYVDQVEQAVDVLVSALRDGYGYGRLALALGRVAHGAVLAVEATRWVFPLGSVPR